MANPIIKRSGLGRPTGPGQWTVLLSGSHFAATITDDTSSPAPIPEPPSPVFNEQSLHTGDLLESERYAELVSIGQGLGLGPGEYIAGGAIRRAFLNIPMTDGDIDIYTAGPGKLKKLRKRLDGWLRTVEVHASRGKTWGRTYEFPLGDKTYRIQLVEFQHPFSAKRLIESFDLTCVQGAYEPCSGTLTTTAAFEQDNLTRTLRWGRLRSIAAMFSRMEKYIGLGYTMDKQERLRVANLLANGNIPPGQDGDAYTEGAPD